MKRYVKGTKACFSLIRALTFKKSKACRKGARKIFKILIFDMQFRVQMSNKVQII